MADEQDENIEGASTDLYRDAILLESPRGGDELKGPEGDELTRVPIAGFA
jgi:hypothetical protein